MKKVVLIIIANIITVLSMTTQAEERIAYIDKHLNLSFPYKAGTFVFRNVTHYQNPDLGYYLQYEGTALIKADVYVYDNGHSKITTGPTGEAVQSEFNAIKNSLHLMIKKRRYKTLTFFKQELFPQKTTIPFITTKYTYTENHSGSYKGERISELYLTGFYGKFIKVRVSYKLTNRGSFEDKIRPLIIELSKQMEKTDIAHRKKQIKNVLSAIGIFMKEPLSSNGTIALSKIFRFADNSSDVLIDLNEKYCIWMDKDIENEHLLLTAYLAGNIKAQLKSKRAKNRPYEGVRYALHTYKKLRKENKVKKIEQLEMWIRLDKVGKLKSFIHSL